MKLSRMLRVVVCLSVVCLLAGSAASSVLGQEWTRFRGPNGTGISPAKGIPVSWSDADYDWKIDLPGIGHSSPVLWGETIFLTSADSKDATRMVHAIDARNGKILWTKKFESALHTKHKYNSFASSTPAVDSERVYVSWTAPEEFTLMALDHRGNVVWNKNLGPFISQHSGGTSPILYGDLVIIGNDQDAEDEDTGEKGTSFLIALDKKTGEQVWKTPRESARVAYSTPRVYQAPGEDEDQLIFNAMSHGITSVDPKTGKVNWELGGLFDKRSCSSPVLAGGLLIGSCGSGGGGNYVVAIKPGDADGDKQPELAYKVDRAAPYVPTPLAKDGLLFLWSDAGIVTCLDAASGEQHWQKRVGGNFFGSPVWVDGKLYCIAVDGEVVVLAASKEYEVLARNSLGDQSHSTPAVADGVMYLRGFSTLAALSGKGSTASGE